MSVISGLFLFSSFLISNFLLESFSNLYLFFFLTKTFEPLSPSRSLILHSAVCHSLSKKKSGCFCLFGLYFFHSGSAVTWQLIHHGSIVCWDEERHVSNAGNKDIKHLSLMLALLRDWPSTRSRGMHLYSLTLSSKKNFDHNLDYWAIIISDFLGSKYDQCRNNSVCYLC